MNNLTEQNKAIAHLNAKATIAWAIEQAERPLLSTHFGPMEGVILHMATQVMPDLQVVWVDSGYNTRDTYKVAEKLIEMLDLKVEVFTPKISAARQDAALGGIPNVDEERHAAFTDAFKLEPFSRAMQANQPDYWFTAVRSEQTTFRQDMQALSAGPNGVIKVAPLLDWKEAEMLAYLEKHKLPNVEKYFDPTKAEAGRECGLHTKL